ncbi:SMI1/KNR4 family protein [Flavobacterium chilense]|uniref:SMI1 / KNR4 family (SUKH-1) n=1 Tax=Flavobacterium chilense TaxID=946677 RepID=A0A1M6Z703_9FLAO|nr:SMI1/KNR4 family protein [Flavobacterium chilense]SHL26266.1 SMI1 / KNR4 family (SUKH-1) [Flavobacterium chilense]
MADLFINTAKSIDENDIKEFEKQLDIILPDEIKKHYLKYNGGFPVKERFYMKDYDTYTSINGFMPIKYHFDNIDDWTMEEVYLNFNITKGILPKNFLAFASDYGGNKFCINIESKKIFLIYMDLGNPMENPNAIRKICSNFDKFIKNLEEEEEEEDDV